MGLCYGCMSPLESDEGSCPYCGYDSSAPTLPAYLTPGVTLNNKRYLVGRLLHYNGEGATYLAYDSVMNQRIFLKEYMPDTLCRRLRNSPVISVNQANLVQYKTFLSEFTELGRVMTRMRTLNHVNPALDLFAENNTTYITSPYVEGVTLRQYLIENAGELSWEEAGRLFPPIFTTLSLLHNAGVVHRGISPETILLTDRRELMLTGICISAARTAGTALAPEMFAGYAAPEQYSPGSWQGTWTDVYAICAVLYRTLTGTTPLEAVARVGGDSLVEPAAINPMIQNTVSKVIMQGMSIHPESRLQTVTELVTRLFEQPGHLEHSRTQTISIPKQGMHSSEELPSSYNSKLAAPYGPGGKMSATGGEGRQMAQSQGGMPPSAPPGAPAGRPPANRGNQGRPDPNGGKKGRKQASRWRVPIIVFLIVVVVLGVAALIALGFINEDLNGGRDSGDDTSVTSTVGTGTDGSSNSTASQTTAAESSSTLPISTTTPKTTIQSDPTFVVPDFVGKNFDAIKDSDYYKDVLVFQAEYEYNDEFPKGQIFNQDISPDKMVPIGQEIKLKVSMGSELTQVPDYFGKDEKTYLAELTKLGIKYVTVKTEDPAVMGGLVSRTSIDPGENIDVANGEVLTVYISTFYPVVSDSTGIYTDDVPLEEGVDINDNSRE